MTQREPSFDDYPYDPRVDGVPYHSLEADMAMLGGLNKLRGIRDRRIARVLFDLYLANEQTGWRGGSGSDRKREAEEAERLETMAKKALAGLYGPSAKTAAVDFVTARGGLQRMDRADLEELRAALRKIPDRWGA